MSTRLNMGDGRSVDLDVEREIGGPIAVWLTFFNMHRNEQIPRWNVDAWQARQLAGLLVLMAEEAEMREMGRVRR